MGETEISWTHKPGTVGRTWNPVQGCRRISAGCEHCYAERLAARFAESGWSKGLINLKTKKWNGESRLATHKLSEPLSWRKPSTVFVNSMSDLFYEGFSNEQIAAVFGVIAAAPQHTFQILTKRAKRMREWFEWIERRAAEVAVPDMVGDDTDGGFLRAHVCAAETHEVLRERDIPSVVNCRWPLPNVWLGVSVENQEAADERIPELLKTPAAIRFLSCEPLIGETDLTPWLRVWPTSRHRHAVDWVIVGCESGPGARPCSVEWLRSLRDQCAAAGVAYFLKQATFDCDVDGNGIHNGDGSKFKTQGARHSVSGRAGALIELPYLDGVQHAAFPEVRS